MTLSFLTIAAGYLLLHANRTNTQPQGALMLVRIKS